MSYYQCIDCSVKLPFKLDLESVIKMGFWPGTPSNFCHLFDRDLLVYWDMAQKRMPGVSERSFITSLEDFSFAKGRVGLYSTAQKEVTTVSRESRLSRRVSCLSRRDSRLARSLKNCKYSYEANSKGISLPLFTMEVATIPHGASYMFPTA